MVLEEEHRWGSRETLWGCQQEITKWWAVEEEKVMVQLETTREER